MFVRGCGGRLLHPRPPEGAIWGKNIRIVHNASDDVGAESCYNFSFPPVRPPWGLQGTISSSPAPPSEWLIMQSICARVPKPVSVQFALYCASLEEKRPRNEIKVIQGVWGSGVPHSPPLGDLGGK